MPATTRSVIDKQAALKTKRKVAQSTYAGKKPVLPEPADRSVPAGTRRGPVLAKLFQNGRSQAVRLPKEFRFQGKEVQVSRQGNSVILTPLETRSRKQYWDEYFKALEPYRDLPFPDCEDDGPVEPDDVFPEDWA